MASKLKIEVGSVVAFSEAAQPTWFDVVAIEGFHLTVREHGHPEYKQQSQDVSSVKQVHGAVIDPAKQPPQTVGQKADIMERSLKTEGERLLADDCPLYAAAVAAVSYLPSDVLARLYDRIVR